LCEALTSDDRRQPTRNQLLWYIEGAQQIWEEVKDKV
jgi:hypothetical protein